MTWIETENIKGIVSEKVTPNLICYYSVEGTTYTFNVLDTEILTPICSIEFQRDFDYKIFRNSIYFGCDELVKKLELGSNSLDSVVTTKDNYVTIVNESRFISSFYDSDKKVYINQLIDENNLVIPEFNGYDTFRDISGDFIISTNNLNTIIALFDLRDNAYLWQIELPNPIKHDAIFINGTILIHCGGNLVSFDLKSGKEMFIVENPFKDYKNDQFYKTLYGLNGNRFEVINSGTGQRELQTVLDDNLHISSHLTYYNDGYLYFSGHSNKNIPVFGAVNVKNGKLEFTQEVKMEGVKSFRKGLDKPYVIGNRLYVKDTMNTLHIFERE